MTITVEEIDGNIRALERDIDGIGLSLPNSVKTWRRELEILEAARAHLLLAGKSEEAEEIASRLGVWRLT